MEIDEWNGVLKIYSILRIIHLMKVEGTDRESFRIIGDDANDTHINKHYQLQTTVLTSSEVPSDNWLTYNKEFATAKEAKDFVSDFIFKCQNSLVRNSLNRYLVCQRLICNH